MEPGGVGQQHRRPAAAEVVGGDLDAVGSHRPGAGQVFRRCHAGDGTASVSAIDVSDAVLAANRRFYQAFEDRNMDAMSDLWERSDRATCTHPGWATLRGWGPIAASFFALFQGSRQMQFVLTEERAQVVGAVAWVSVDENLLGDQGGATIAAINIFACREDMFGDQPEAWRMVCHHGSVISHPLVREGPAEV